LGEGKRKGSFMDSRRKRLRRIQTAISIVATVLGVLLLILLAYLGAFASLSTARLVILVATVIGAVLMRAFLQRHLGVDDPHNPRR